MNNCATNNCATKTLLAHRDIGVTESVYSARLRVVLSRLCLMCVLVRLCVQACLRQVRVTLERSATQFAYQKPVLCEVSELGYRGLPNPSLRTVFPHCKLNAIGATDPVKHKTFTDFETNCFMPIVLTASLLRLEDDDHVLPAMDAHDSRRFIRSPFRN